MVMEEEKYNVNILAAEDVNCPGEFNFYKLEECFNLSLAEWKSGPSFVCFVRVKVKARQCQTKPLSPTR